MTIKPSGISRRRCTVVLFSVLLAASHAQLPPATTKPGNLPPIGGSSTTNRLPGGLPSTVKNTPPPREVKLVEKKVAELSNQDSSDHGTKALSINPDKWKHAETENFILHYRRLTEAQKVAREVEYQLWYVASFLGATKERYTRKSHVYVFEDDEEWKAFTSSSTGSIGWAKSFAYGDDLFLNVRGGGNTGSGSFDFMTLAHEATHAVVSRLFPDKRWPLWMNEGFAETMAATTVGARKSGGAKRLERSGAAIRYTPDQLIAIEKYPSDPIQIRALYESSQKLMGFIINELPKDRFLPLVDAVLAGKPFPEAVVEVYSDRIKSWEDFNKRYERYVK